MSTESPLKEIVEVESAHAGTWSPAVKGAGLIYLSGTLAEDGSGAIVEKDVGAQTRRVLERMGTVLSAAGSSLEDAVSVLVHLRSAADFAAMNEAYRGFWRSAPPARTTIVADLAVPEALVEISMIAAPSGAGRLAVHPPSWSPSPHPYSYGIRSGDTLFMSGLVPRRGRDNSVVGGDITAQTRAVMDNAGELLEAAGLSFSHVVCARVYLTEAANFRGMNQVYRSCFADGFPARATVTCGLAGPEFLVEMTFTASSAPREIIGAPPEGVPISPAVKAGHRLYLSGMLGNTPETAGNVGAQTRETLARIGRTLELAGASPADVVDAAVYLKHVAGFGDMNREYRTFFGGGFPARTTIGAPLVVDDGLVEIMVTGVVR